MRHTLATLLAAGPFLLWGCTDSARVTAPDSADPLVAANASPASPGSANAPAVVSHSVQLLDKCDPFSFNAAVGPGTCLSAHPGLKFDAFVNQLLKHQKAPAWRNAPQNFTLPFGGSIVAINRGGEVHTFTEVAAFGGGVVPLLNQLDNTPTPAPECLAAPQSEYLPPGGTDTEIVTQHGTLYFQCCIHPWMRTTVVVP